MIRTVCSKLELQQLGFLVEEPSITDGQDDSLTGFSQSGFIRKSPGMKPHTRNYDIANLFSCDDWNENEENFLVEQLEYAALNIPVSSITIFDTCLWFITGLLIETFGKEFSIPMVKQKVINLRRQYNSFLEWKQIPGVYHNRKSNRVSVDGVY